MGVRPQMDVRLKTIWSGFYFNSRDAKRRPVTITVMQTGLRLATEDETLLWWPYNQIRQTQGFYAGEQIRLEKGTELTEVLVVTDPAFLAAVRRVAPGFGARFRPPARVSKVLTVGLIAAAGAILIGLALYLWGIPALADAAASRIPAAWEEALGQAVVENLAPANERCTDPDRIRRIQQIVAALVAAGPPSPYTFRVAVADEPIVNAFAAPGGYLVINRGLLEKTERPEELAGVLAHEIQHVVQRHATRALFREMSIRVLLATLTGDANGLAQALSAAGKLGELRYRRGDEEAADRDGMKMLQAARIDPAGMISFFRNLQRQARGGPQLPTYLSTHPQTADRIDRLERLAAQAHYVPITLLPGYTWRDIKKICR